MGCQKTNTHDLCAKKCVINSTSIITEEIAGKMNPVSRKFTREGEWRDGECNNVEDGSKVGEMKTHTGSTEKDTMTIFVRESDAVD